MASRYKVQRTAANGNGHSGLRRPSSLEAPEHALLDSARTGQPLDLPLAEPPDGQASVEFEAMLAWGADRTIHAEVLRHLLIDSEWPVHAKGVRLRGARIVGTLDLESTMLTCPLDLQDCYVEQPVLLDYATASLLKLVHCWLAGLKADLLIVTKELDLSRSRFSGAVRLLGADITGQLSCRDAQLGDTAGENTGRDNNGSDNTGSHKTGSHKTGNDNNDGGGAGRKARGNVLIADRMTVRGNVLLDGAFTAAGAVRLPGARITGQLSCRGAQITGTDSDGDALIADEVTVGAGVFLDRSDEHQVGFTTAGAVRLSHASLTGRLSCRGAQVGADNFGNALFADRMTVGGDLLLIEGFTAAGTVRLPGASITGQFSCRDAHLTGRDKDGDALMADRITVSGGVLLDKGFTAAGAVRLLRARVTGQLSCNGAQITRPNTRGNALAANEITVGSDVLLNEGFRAEGAVKFSGARIDGCLSLVDGTIDGPVALIAEGATIGQQLVWSPRRRVTGLVSLERTQVHRLDDDWRKFGAYWPNGGLRGRLLLAGFVYDGFGGEGRATSLQRLIWIRSQHRKPTLFMESKAVQTSKAGQMDQTGKPRRQGGFDAQPYEQLARVYRQSGQDSEARQIAIAQRNDLRTYATLGRWRRLGSQLLDVTIKHGYQPLRAVVMLLVVYLVAAGLFWVAQNQADVMVPKGASSSQLAPAAKHCTSAYPCFSPAGFAMDVTIPIIKTGQSDSWRVNAAADFGWVYLWGTWIFTGVGWALTTLAVAGYTGLIRKD